MFLKSKNAIGIFILFIVSFFFIITPIFQSGWFGDGIMYIAVGFNRYMGDGTLWHQHYTSASMPFFCEQPPLFFEGLNIFYLIFGPSDYSERFFICFLWVCTLMMILLIWKKLNAGKTDLSLGAIAVILLMTTPVFSWSFCNAVIETQTTFLSLFGFFCFYNHLTSEKGFHRWLWFFGFLLLLFALLLTKGLQSAFLLAAPLLAAFSRIDSLKNALLKTVMAITILMGTLFFIFYFNVGARGWLDCYFSRRIIGTFAGQGATTGSHFEIIIRFFTELIPAGFVFGVLIAAFKFKFKYPVFIIFKNILRNKFVVWLFFIALAGSLPLSVTLEQRGFYLVPAFPFAILGLCLGTKRYLSVAIRHWLRISKAGWRIIILFTGILAGFYFFLMVGNPKRDGEMLRDVKALSTLIPSGEGIGIDSSLRIAFSLQSYLNRYNRNFLIVSAKPRFYIISREKVGKVPPGMIKVELKTYWLDLYYNPAFDRSGN